MLVGKDGLGPWQDEEMRGCLSEFVSRKLPVIPVLLPGAPDVPRLPFFLKRFTWVDLRGGLTEEGIDRLQWGITGKKPGRDDLKETQSLAVERSASQQQAEVEPQRRAAEQRTRFEQAVFRVRTYVAEQKLTPPETFISYAWGVPEHERWVEKQLATDLYKAGIEVVLDRWHNAVIGASVARFVASIEKSDRIVIVGTPLYRRKFENKDTSTGYVVAAEVDLIVNRLLGTELQKQSVLPLLLAGERTASLPPLLNGRVYADFRDETAYFTTTFDLILSLYQLPPNYPAVVDLRESLREPEMR